MSYIVVDRVQKIFIILEKYDKMFTLSRNYKYVSRKISSMAYN